MTNRSLEAIVSIARALGHPARMRTVAMLRSGELCVCQITAVLELAPSTVSAHLRELRQAGLTVERKVGRWVYVGLTEDPALQVWIDTAIQTLAGDPQLDADDHMVAELRRLPLGDLCSLGYEGAKAKHDLNPEDTCREKIQ